MVDFDSLTLKMGMCVSPETTQKECIFSEVADAHYYYHT